MLETDPRATPVGCLVCSGLPGDSGPSSLQARQFILAQGSTCWDISVRIFAYSRNGSWRQERREELMVNVDWGWGWFALSVSVALSVTTVSVVCSEPLRRDTGPCGVWHVSTFSWRMCILCGGDTQLFFLPPSWMLFPLHSLPVCLKIYLFEK